MGRPSTIEARSPFGEWLDGEIEKRGLERKSVAIRAGIGKTSVTQLIAGVRNPSRDMVGKIAAALVGDDAEPETVRRLTNAGIRAAFPTDDGERGPIETIVEEAGFSSGAMSEAELADLRDDVDSFVKAVLAKRGRARG